MKVTLKFLCYSVMSLHRFIKYGLVLFFIGTVVLPSSAGDRKISVAFLFSFPEIPVLRLELSEPAALTIDAKGNIFVVDTGNSRILKFDHHGKYLKHVGGFGWNQEEFDRPLDISVKFLLDVFVADFNNERIERYDNDLNFISSLYSDSSDPATLRFGLPTSVDISKHGDLFLCDSDNNRVLKFNASGEPLLSFGDFDDGAGHLEYPAKIEISTNDLVYVIDQAADDVVVFDYYGNFLTRFGSPLLNKPNGIERAGAYNFVADSGNDRMVVFDDNHEFLATWGSSGTKFGAFDNPTDIAYFDDKIYVLDSNNSRVQVFRLSFE